RVFPGRKFDVQIEAAGGLTLEEAIRELRKINRRPDAIVIYSGHNEFQARYGWSRNVKYYLDEKPRQRGALVALTGRLSPLCGLIEDTIDKHRVDEPPPKDAHRELIDHPSFTPEEYAFLRTDFHRRLEGIVAYCERIGALPILISPAGNEGDFPPDRSYLFPAVPLADREAAARRFQEARSIELTDPAAAVRLFRALLAQHPTFAEAHYRLAKLLEQGGEWPLAREHYLKARDCDGLPMRCPTDFLAAYPEVARRHDAIFVDGPAVFARLSPHGIIDDHLIHDGQHPTLRGYIALTQDLLEKLHTRHAFGWPDSVATPVIDPSECASHFELDAAKWSFVCHHTAGFHARTSKLRYDPSEHLARVQRLVDAANQIEAGKSPDEVGITGLGVHPSGLRER
ncbi:MAG TPA: tetratricopeptide repeat protein, partial [Isosphaeraceae bacterium]|nr:tetratricopeptide repeat protein [Isosphaeraceae bacterium]